MVFTVAWSGWLYFTKSSAVNEIPFREDRSFIHVFSWTGWIETQLIFSMLASPRTFYPSVEKHIISKGYQPLFKEMAEKLNIEFLFCLDFEMIKKPKNWNVVFDTHVKKFIGGRNL